MKISCIIPAYNEALRISNVLDIVVGHPLIDEVIVINDASTDDTGWVLSKIQGISVIKHERNKGKTKAVLAGMREAKNNLLMLIDSDLIGLSSEDITRLAEPVLQGKKDVTISLRKNALTIYKILGIDFVSGERLFHRNIISEHLQDLESLPGFGLEVFINSIIIRKHLRLGIIKWNDVISPRKSVKAGTLRGIIGDAKMVYQVLSTISLWKCISQIVALKKLSRD